MKLNKLFSAVLVAGASVSAQAAVLLSEGFDNVAGLPANGWVQVNNSVGGGAGWFQGNAGVATSSSGAPDSYAAANFVVTSSVTAISEWLMTPVIDASGGSILTFDLRLLGDGFLDTVEVYVSNSGSSSNVNDFTSLVGTYSNAGPDTGWTTQTLSLSGFNGRIGFRYYVADTSIDGNYVGIDSVSVVPEPTSVALAALALAGLAATRRRA